MARSFGNSAANYLSRAASLISATDPRPCSLHVRWKPTNRLISASLFNNGFNAVATDGRWRFRQTNDGVNDAVSFQSGGNSIVSANSNITAGTWITYGVSWAADGSVVIYRDGAQLSTGSLTLDTGAGTQNGASIGSLDGSIQGIDGHVADVAVWNVVLSAGEFLPLGNRLAPSAIRPTALRGYVDIIGRNSPELDFSGTNWTVNGTLTRSDHPPIAYPSGAR